MRTESDCFRTSAKKMPRCVAHPPRPHLHMKHPRLEPRQCEVWAGKSTTFRSNRRTARSTHTHTHLRARTHKRVLGAWAIGWGLPDIHVEGPVGIVCCVGLVFIRKRFQTRVTICVMQAERVRVAEEARFRPPPSLASSVVLLLSVISWTNLLQARLACVPPLSGIAPSP
jgi:hypothetical protein